MAYTAEPIDGSIPSAKPQAREELPSKEFIGYDPKGTTSVTGSPIEHKEENPKQENEDKRGQTATDPAEESGSITLSPKLTALARKEQAQRQREKLLEQRENDLAEKLAKAQKFDELQTKIKARDFSGAEELGLTNEQYTEYLLDKESSKNPEVERVKRLETEIEALKRQQEESTVREYEANQALWKAEIARAVSENADFSTIKDLGAENIVLQHINDSFEEDGVELTVEQAAKEIEDLLVLRAEKFASVTKLKDRQGQPKVLGAPKPQTKTITQNMTVTSKTPVKKPFHLMSESEQIAEAIRRVEEEKLRRFGAR